MTLRKSGLWINTQDEAVGKLWCLLQNPARQLWLQHEIGKRMEMRMGGMKMRTTFEWYVNNLE